MIFWASKKFYLGKFRQFSQWRWRRSLTNPQSFWLLIVVAKHSKMYWWVLPVSYSQLNLILKHGGTPSISMHFIFQVWRYWGLVRRNNRFSRLLILTPRLAPLSVVSPPYNGIFSIQRHPAIQVLATRAGRTCISPIYLCVMSFFYR